MNLDQEQLLSRFQSPVSKARNSREEMIDRFVERLNEGRKGTRYKPMTARVVAVKLSHIPTEALYETYQKCEGFKSFSAGFFYFANKPKKV